VHRELDATDVFSERGRGNVEFTTSRTDGFGKS